MKTDVLTIAAIVFIGGLLLSSLSVSDIFDSPEQEMPVAMEQGEAAR